MKRRLLAAHRQIAALLLVPLLLILTSCGGDPAPTADPAATAIPSGSSSATATPADTPAISTPTPTVGDAATAPITAGITPISGDQAGTSDAAKEAILAALRAQGQVKSCRVHWSDVILSNGVVSSNFTADYDFVLPDRYRVTEQDLSGAPLVTIRSGNTTYEQSNGTWTAVQNGLSAPEMMNNIFYNSTGVDGVADTMSDPRLLGSATLNGTAMRVYEYITTPILLTITNTLWVGTGDGLPYQRVSSTVAESGGDRSEDRRSSVFSDYNTAIPIDVPLP